MLASLRSQDILGRSGPGYHRAWSTDWPRGDGATCAGAWCSPALVRLLCPASGIVILTLLAGALGLALAATAVGAPDRSGRTGQPGAPRVVPAAEPPSR